MTLAFRRLAPGAVLLAFLGTSCGVLENITGPDGMAIKKFAVSPKEVTATEAATLSWDVEGAESIQIDNGIGVVKAKDSLEVKADKTTTYKITARAGTSSATATVQLLVGPGRASGSAASFQ
jgi:hypothetical protein